MYLRAPERRAASPSWQRFFRFDCLSLREWPRAGGGGEPTAKDKGVQLEFTVEDPGAFTMPWNAVQRYRRDQRKEEVPLHEMVCAENNGDHFNQGLVPIPQADKAEF